MSNFPVNSSPREGSKMKNLGQTSTMAPDKVTTQEFLLGEVGAMNSETATEETRLAQSIWMKGKTHCDIMLKDSPILGDTKAIKTSCVASLGLILRRVKSQYPDTWPKKPSSHKLIQSKKDIQDPHLVRLMGISSASVSNIPEYPASIPESPHAQSHGALSTKTSKLNKVCTEKSQPLDLLEAAQILQRICSEFRLLVMTSHSSMTLSDVPTACRVLEACQLVGYKSDELLGKVKDLILCKEFNKQSATLLRSQLLACGYDPENDVMQVLMEF